MNKPKLVARTQIYLDCRKLLDVELVQALAKHWLVIIDRQADNVKIEVYPKTNI